jgi:hypothetical protein
VLPATPQGPDQEMYYLIETWYSRLVFEFQTAWELGVLPIKRYSESRRVKIT